MPDKRMVIAAAIPNKTRVIGVSPSIRYGRCPVCSTASNAAHAWAFPTRQRVITLRL